MESYTLDQLGTTGGTGRNNRLLVNAVVWRVRTGVPQCDLPDRFGN